MSQILPILAVVAAVLVVLLLLGTQSVAIGQLIGALLMIPTTLVRVVREGLDDAATWLRDAANTLIRRGSEAPETTWIGTVVIVNLLTAAVLIVIAVADLQLLLMTLPFLGMALEALPLSVELAWLVAASITALAVFWGIVFLESTAFTRATPIARRCLQSPRARYLFTGTSLAALLALAYLGTQLAAIRSYEATAPAEYQQGAVASDPFAIGATAPVPPATAPAPTTTTDFDPVVAIDRVNKTLIVVSTVSLFIGKWAIVALFAHLLALILAATWLILLPVRFVVSLVESLLTVIADHVAPATLGFGRDVARSGIDWYQRLGDPSLQKELEAITQAAATHAQEMEEHVVHAAASVNGHRDEAVAVGPAAHE